MPFFHVYMLCADLDDCIDNSCQHKCTDILGGYECSCNTGYSLNSDQHNCSGKALGVGAVEMYGYTGPTANK